MTHRAHARVDENLRHRVLGSRITLHLPGAVDGLHKIEGVIVGDKLQRVGDAVDEILLFDYGHRAGVLPTAIPIAYPANSVPPYQPQAARYWR